MDEVQKERRHHIWLCRESLDHLSKVKESMWRIEEERAKRFSRADRLAVKADEVLWGTRKQIEKVIEIMEELEQEEATATLKGD